MIPLLLALDSHRAEAGVESWFGFDFSDANALLLHNRHDGIRVLDGKDRFIGSRGDYYGPPLPYEDIPHHLILLLVTQEDRHFLTGSGWRIGGFDLGGIGRAIAVNIRRGRLAQGGSTLSQQVLKELFLKDHGKIERKVEELVLTPGLDGSLTKAQILFLYLNRVYFGAGAYGIEAAARVFFDKPARDLNLQEAAALIQALNAPSRRNLFADPATARKRARALIERAVALEFIAPKTAAAGLKQPFRAAPDRRLHGGFYPEHPHHGWYVRHAESESRLFDISKEGVRTIETFFDRDLQHAAQTALATAVARYGASFRSRAGSRCRDEVEWTNRGCGRRYGSCQERMEQRDAGTAPTRFRFQIVCLPGGA